MPSGSLTVNEDPKKFVFNKVKYQFLAAICGKYPEMIKPIFRHCPLKS